MEEVEENEVLGAQRRRKHMFGLCLRRTFNSCINYW